MNKNIIRTIQHHLPLYWQARQHQLHLCAVTASLENGTCRTRHLYTAANIQDALLLSQRILESGGALDVSALDWNALDLWQYGWTPELGNLRQRVITLRPTVSQPDWAGYAASLKARS